MDTSPALQCVLNTCYVPSTLPVICTYTEFHSSVESLLYTNNTINSETVLHLGKTLRDILAQDHIKYIHYLILSLMVIQHLLECLTVSHGSLLHCGSFLT